MNAIVCQAACPLLAGSCHNDEWIRAAHSQPGKRERLLAQARLSTMLERGRARQRTLYRCGGGSQRSDTLRRCVNENHVARSADHCFISSAG